MTTSKTQSGWGVRGVTLGLVVALMLLSGCVLGYRYQGVSDEAVNDQSQRADVEGTGHMVYLGLTLDFRFFRVGTPSIGGNFEMSATSEGGLYRDEYIQQMNGFELDVPVISFWSEDEGVGYPGLLKHRHSVDLWLSGTIMPLSPPHWWTDASIVYYNHDLVAVRVFGGYGRIPFDGTLRGWDGHNQTFEIFDTTVGGPTYGAELTVLAGEQALDFIKWFGNAQDAAADEASGGR